jgi:hypothetical protein
MRPHPKRRFAFGIGKILPRRLAHNVLRHSFGSYFYALTKNENTVAVEMGNSPEMVFRHYRALVKPSDCTAFWGIRPV